jgi:hypothetical protein
MKELKKRPDNDCIRDRLGSKHFTSFIGAKPVVRVFPYEHLCSFSSREAKK